VRAQEIFSQEHGYLSEEQSQPLMLMIVVVVDLLLLFVSHNTELVVFGRSHQVKTTSLPTTLRGFCPRASGGILGRANLSY